MDDSASSGGIVCCETPSKMKVWLANEHFKTNEELMDGVKNWLGTLAEPFCDEGLQNLVRRYDKCLNLGGNYVEK
jgi:hypothetical protein